MMIAFADFCRKRCQSLWVRLSPIIFLLQFHSLSLNRTRLYFCHVTAIKLCCCRHSMCLLASSQSTIGWPSTTPNSITPIKTFLIRARCAVSRFIHHTPHLSVSPVAAPARRLLSWQVCDGQTRWFFRESKWSGHHTQMCLVCYLQWQTRYCWHSFAIVDALKCRFQLLR